MQVFTDERLVEAMRITHWVSSVLFVVGLVAHQLLRRNGNGAAKEPLTIEEREVW